MRMHSRRRGTIIPILALSIVGLLGLIALAIDIGLIAVARTQAQSAADISALSGARMLTGNSSNTYNIATSVSTAKTNATYNKILNQSVTTGDVTVRTGVYKYDTASQRFIADPASYTTSTSASPPSGGGSWTASESTITVAQPTYFARVLGINTFNVNATATAVHRPRDISVILDFSGSMRFSSQSHWPDTGTVSGSLNPDPTWPKFGHYSRYVGLSTGGANPMQRTTDYTLSSGENNAPNNLTITTDSGPPVIGDSTDSTKQYFLSRNGGGALVSAWNYPQGGSFNANQTPVAQPAPASFENDSASGYVGDKQPRDNGSFTGSNWAATVQEWLAGNSTAQSTTHARSNTNGPSGARFDAVTGVNNGYGANFQGYSMGPGYYGKTFWMWPPDPRFDSTTNGSASTADPTNPSTTLTVPPRDTGGRYICDWRGRFFKYGSSHARSGQRVDDNSILFDSNGDFRAQSSTGFAVDYTAIIKWLTSGPLVLPTNLRAGRVLYYEAIPTTIPASGGTLDQIFWREYIDYVLGLESTRLGERTLYGIEPTNWQVSTKVTARSSLLSSGNRANSTSPAPYMHYNDNPKRPRLHYWFGPLSMLMFITESNQVATNMWPGTCSEAQTWQLKAGVQSAIDDVKSNHPNDWLALIYFSGISGYNTPRVKLSQDYTKMKNALWFPFSLLDSLGNANSEIRPYNTSFAYTGDADIPNANGSTCPTMGLMLAYNEFSTASGYNGRKGAAKLVVLESDGVPNTSCGGSLSNNGAYLSTYGSASSIGSTTSQGNNASGAVNPALNAVTQITNLDSSSGKGFSTTRVPARVHAIAFGDLFETSTQAKTDALTFLTNVQINGKTTASGGSLESYKIIVGNYNARIDNLRQAFERIFQSGVQVTLIK